MLDRQLGLGNPTLVQEHLDLRGSRIRRCSRDGVQQPLRRLSRLGPREALRHRSKSVHASRSMNKGTQRPTRSRMNLRHAAVSSLMNSVSSSLSVYHGPPVISVEGSRWKSMYILRVGCCRTRLCQNLAVPKERRRSGAPVRFR